MRFDDKKTPVTVFGGTAYTRSSFDNMVLLNAKNFQLVKFSQADFGIKTPPANVQTDGVTFFGERLATSTQGVWIRTLVTISG